MKIVFEKETHEYTIDGHKAVASVTQLLGKHRLAPNYDKVANETVKRKAESGTAIHKDLENVLNKAKYQPKTPQGETWKEWVYNNVDCAVGEQMLGLNCYGYYYGGTADVMGWLKSGECFVGDHKTTATFDREYVTWQVNLLDYFARKLNGQNLNGKAWHWKGATRFFCFWWHDGDLQVKELDKIADSEIERFILCEKNGEIYQRPTLVIDNDLRQQFEQAELRLCEIEQQAKVAKANCETLRQRLTAEMERQNIRSFETDKIRLTYIPPTQRMTVDSTKLKRNYPLVFGDVQKITDVKASVRITVKDGNDDDEIP